MSPDEARGHALVLTPEQEAKCLLLVKMALAAVQARQPAIGTDDAIGVAEDYINWDALDDMADDFADDVLEG